MALVALGVIALYAMIALFAKFGLIATPWDAEVAASYAEPSAESI